MSMKFCLEQIGRVEDVKEKCGTDEENICKARHLRNKCYDIINCARADNFSPLRHKNNVD